MTPRELVVKAAEGNHSASDWFSKDERGSWEKLAGELLEETAEKRAAFVRAGVRPEVLFEELANRLKLLGLRALMAEAKRVKGRRG